MTWGKEVVISLQGSSDLLKPVSNTCVGLAPPHLPYDGFQPVSATRCRPGAATPTLDLDCCHHPHLRSITGE